MSNTVFLIPSGPKNLASIFPTVDFASVTDYYLEIQDISSTVLATTPTYKANCCCGEGYVRIHFLNYLGTYDAVNFLKPTIEHDDTSTSFINGLNYPLSKTDTGAERFNITSNDIFTVKRKSKESEMGWLQECADSPKLFLEWTGIEGQADDYIPLIKVDDKFIKQKFDGSEWEYDFIIQFKLSNEYFGVRN